MVTVTHTGQECPVYVTMVTIATMVTGVTTTICYKVVLLKRCLVVEHALVQQRLADNLLRMVGIYLLLRMRLMMRMNRVRKGELVLVLKWLPWLANRVMGLRVVVDRLGRECHNSELLLC